jgi:uncharacterized protein (UPF0332 family)
MAEHEYPFLYKARQSLAGAESELGNRRHDNAANRCYYAAFQAAIAALQQSGISAEEWGHDFVPAEFEGRLIYRRKLYPTELRGTLGRLYSLRETADYDEDVVSRTEAERAVRRTRTFVEAVETQLARR